MKRPSFNWTREPWGYALRDERGYARASMGLGKDGFYGTVFEPGLPSAGPYRSRINAAKWVTGSAIRLGHLPSNSKFGELPI